MSLHRLDINNAFLHNFVDEKIYMLPPPGYVVQPRMVCRMKRSLSGLRQAARQWNAELSKQLIPLGFKQSSQGYSLFFKTDSSGAFIVVAYLCR